ncbi:hypothetical protein MRB53_027711 [Persea americana]|uniref:Uncharacterized protein n=1 Tax=Persea americana TaxID=3435 RepID=A0ACC2LLX1_PERAE|nr:hypothetical protein MRB53_027711 [Persea americana]
MASSSFYLFVFLCFALALRSNAANCSSQSFSKNRVFALCSDLSHLNASLHWNYNALNSSLDLAFVAPPAKSDGWIAWGINPTAEGMVGAQALIAFRGSNGSMAVHTYNITSYQGVFPSPIAFHVWSTSAEHSHGTMLIFASMALPEKTTTVNHVWQVGASVNGTLPAKHSFAPENLNAKGKLDLTSGGGSSGGAPAPSGGGAAPAPSGGGAATAPSGGGPTSSVSSLLSHSLPFSSFVAIIIIFSTAFASIF